jgi:predicted double-glycine peptidase
MKVSNCYVIALITVASSLITLSPALLADAQGIVVDENDIIPGDRVTCGIQCVYLLCKLHDVSVDINHLLKTISYKEGGTSMLDLKKAAENLGFTCQGYEVSFAKLRQLPLPAIVHLKRSHYLVLLSVGPKTVKVADPPSRSLEIGHKEFIDEWSGHVLTCERSKNILAKAVPSKTGETVYIENPVWDLGVCPSGNTYNHSFILVNAGKTPIEVTSIKPSCGCAVAELSTKHILPGKTAQIDATLHTAGRSGPFGGRIIVQTDNVDYPVLAMEIRAELKLYQGSLSVFPENVVWEEILRGKGATRKIKVIRHGEDPLNFIRATCDIPHLTLNVLKNQSGTNPGLNKYVEIEAQVDSNMPTGPFQGTLTIETEHSKYPTVQIPISGTVIAGVKAEPRVLFLSLKQGNPTERTIVLENVLDESFKIERVSLNPPDFPGEVSYSKVTGSLWHISFLSHGSLPKQIMQGTIVVDTNLSDMPQITIPITVIKAN